MTDTKWTPGPWGKPDYHNDVGPDDGYFIQWLEAGPAKVEFYGRDGEAQALHDAHLIAAAPDLYAALETLVTDFDSIQGHHFNSPRFAPARDALAKARGEANA